MEKENIQPKSRIPLKWQAGSGVQKKEADLSFFDCIFILSLVLTLSEAFLLGPIVENIKAGRFTQQKPSWALVTVIVLYLEPYKNVLYQFTFAIASIWVLFGIYKKWFKKGK